MLSCALVASVSMSQVMIEGGSIENADIRYPPTAPDCVDLVFYGVDLDPSCITRTWNTDILLRSDPNTDERIGLQWGRAEVLGVEPDLDPNSETFGLDCLTVRYSGPPRQELIGRLVHVGASVRPGKAIVKTEIWWTFDGQRIQRPCDPRITWICRDNTWLVCIENNNPFPIYLYGCRFFGFPDGVNVTLPQLDDLTLQDLNPEQFGTQWNPIIPPDQGIGLPPGIFCLRPKCRIYLPITVTRWFPLVFQLAARNSPEAFQFDPIEGPQPGDFLPDPTGSPEGGIGTIFIGQSRPPQSFQSDLNGDGVVNIRDVFERLAPEFGQVSQDVPEAGGPR
ncbi:MAG: hypothetical protein AAGI17_08735 [Planctomycetota bacterium]